MTARRHHWRALPSALLVVVAAAVASPDLRSRPASAPASLRPAGSAIAAAPAARPVTWCGDAAVAADRKPDAELSSQRQVHALYAVPADAEDRFAELASSIATDIGAIDDWWRGQDPSRAPRWDRFAFPGCGSRAGSVDLVAIRLPRASDAYADSRDLRPLLDDLVAVVGPLEKTLVYYDGPRTIDEVCGTSEIAPLYPGRLGFSFVWLRASCNQDVGTGGAAAATAAHELLHSLGAVQLEGPPNRCLEGSRIGHVCDSPRDVMFPYSSGLPLPATVLDANRDDYYAHGSTWWDVRESPWLMHLPQRQLTVSVRAQGGAGVVTSEPAAIACGSGSCEAVLDDGLRVVLRARAAPGSRLWGWHGACSGWAPRCALTLRGPSAAVATFGPNRYRVSVRVRGRGRVTSVPRGAACASACAGWFAPETVVRLHATPAPGWRFAGWASACRGRGACVLTADHDLAAEATFSKK